MSQAPKNKDLPNLYKAVGEAISMWSTIEMQLQMIFGACLQLVAMQPGGGWSYDNTATSSVLDSIEGFRGRMLMIDAALVSALGGLDEEADAILADWAVERKKVNNLHGNRNALAHWRAIQIRDHRGELKKFVIQSPSLAGFQDEGATETDVLGWAKSFTVARDRLQKITVRIVSHRGLQRRHLEQATSQILNCLPSDPTLLEYLKQQLSEHL